MLTATFIYIFQNTYFQHSISLDGAKKINKKKSLLFSLLILQVVSWPCNQAYCRGTGPQWRAGAGPGQF